LNYERSSAGFNQFKIMKLKRAFKLKQVKIHKKLNDYLKKYIDDKKIYNDLVRLRELVDEQDKLLGID